jgi:hypothetical protein
LDYIAFPNGNVPGFIPVQAEIAFVSFSNYHLDNIGITTTKFLALRESGGEIRTYTSVAFVTDYASPETVHEVRQMMGMRVSTTIYPSLLYTDVAGYFLLLNGFPVSAT